MNSLSKNARMLTLVAMYVGVVGAIFISSTMSTMLPLAAQEVGGMEYYSLVNNLCGAVGVALMPLYGYIAAKKPHIKLKLFAVSMFIGVAVVLSRVFANSMWMLIIPNIFYATVTGAIYVLGFAMIRELFDPVKAGMYLGLVGTFQSVGMIVAPVIAGLIMDNGSWRTVNHLVWPLLLLSGILALIASREAKPQENPNASRAKFDAIGSVALAFSSGGIILVLSLGSNLAPFGGMLSNVIVVVTVVALIILAMSIKSKGDDSVVPIGVLKDRNALCLSMSTITAMFSNMAVFFFIPSYCIYVLGASATEASLCTTLFSVAGVFLGPFLGRKVGQSGTVKGVYTFCCCVRFLILGIFILFLSPSTPIWVVWICMLVGSFWNGSQAILISVAPQIQIPEAYRVQGASIVSVSQNLGSSIGTAVYTLFLGAMVFADGMKVSLIVAMAAAIVSFLFILPVKKLPYDKA